jgi:hypothetical protein
MIGRQRIVLDLVRRAPAPPSQNCLMSWLLLLREETAVGRANAAFYDFVPCATGPFSFVAQHEVAALADAGLLDRDRLQIPHGALATVATATAGLHRSIREAVDQFLERYGHSPPSRLADVIRDRYPRYAGRGVGDERTKAAANVAVYTIGYEGRSVDALLGILMRRGIRRVLDVRSNAFSRKFGFTAGTLRALCGNAGIAYTHLPQLGVPRALRVDLSSTAVREKLLDHYERAILPTKESGVEEAAGLMREMPSALLCFELDPRACHRGRLAPCVARLAGLAVQHL